MSEQLFDMEQYMQRCLQLAQKALGMTYPNPLVGCVIVHKGEIIGEGFHAKAGMPHAEVNAINSVKNHELLKESTLYVNLEPCAHFGRTPPCARLIVEKRIPKVVIGCVDSFSEVAGKGIEIMRSQGIDVVVGVCEKEARELNRRFFTFHEQKRPYIILKWAQSADGFMDAIRVENQKPVWLTNEWARRLVHRQRTEEMAILVGSNTALLDNPALTVRQWHGNQPLRVVIDRRLELPQSLNLFSDGNDTLVVNALKTEKVANISYRKVDFTSNVEEQLLMQLFHEGIQSVIVEGGSATLRSFIDRDLWDEAFVYHGGSELVNGIEAPTLKCKALEIFSLNECRLFVYRNLGRR